MSIEEKTVNEKAVTSEKKAIAETAVNDVLVEEEILDLLDKLPYEKVQEVLDFVKFLVQQVEKNPPPKKLRRNVEGLWADLDINLNEEDLAEARREMWGNFPREIEL